MHADTGVPMKFQDIAAGEDFHALNPGVKSRREINKNPRERVFVK